MQRGVVVIDWAHYLGIVGRIAAVYVVSLVLLRAAGRRTMAQLRPIDLLTMLLLSETVSPALTGGDESLGAGLLAAATLVGLATATAYLTFRFRPFDDALDGRTLELIRDGRLDGDVLRRCRITDEALRTALHEGGVLSVGEVKRAYVEPDGQIAIVPVKKT